MGAEDARKIVDGDDGFGGGRYSPHRLWEVSGLRTQGSDGIKMRRVLDVTGRTPLSPRVIVRGCIGRGTSD